MMRNMLPRALIPCLVAAIVTAAGVLAGPAALATAPSPGTVQVTGTQLKSALLPLSAFGHGGDFRVQDSGRTLEHAADPDVASIRCSLFSVLQRIRLNSESITRLGGRQAFQVTQTIYISGPDAPPPYETKTLFAVDGADAFILNSGTGRDASPASATPAALILGLIARVQALRLVCTRHAHGHQRVSVR
jgi:hypothetical protein